MRQVARHLWVGEALQGRYEEKEGWEPNILHSPRGPISRCSLVGVLLSVNNQYLLDDGTGQMPLRIFDSMPQLQPSLNTMVQIIGRPRVYNDQRFLIPEIIHSISPDWAAVRKYELGIMQHHTEEQVEPEVQEEVPQPENKAELLISITAGLDKGEGAPIDEVIRESKLGDTAEKIIEQLLMDGEIFEIKPGVVKVL